MIGWLKKVVGNPTREEPMATRAPRRNFPELYPRSMVLRVTVDENPKRKNTQSYARFEHYATARTVGEALDLGVLYKDIDHDQECNYIRLISGDAA
jgi:hypothetical protein